jgi:hypothetical protein
MAISKTRGAWSTWAAVALNAVGEGAIIDTSLHYLTRLHIEAFLDTAAATAHTGTQVIVQAFTGVDPAGLPAAVDEYWANLLWWTILVGTCNPEPQLHLTDPAPVATTLFPVTSTNGYVVADVAMPWIALQDATLANSELLLLKAITANQDLTVVDGTVRTHAKTTAIFGNIAYNQTIPIVTKDIMGLRILMNNNFDSNGAIMNWRFAWTANLK